MISINPLFKKEIIVKVSKTSRLYRFAAWDKGSSWKANTGCELLFGILVSIATVFGLIMMSGLMVGTAGVLVLVTQGMTADDALLQPFRLLAVGAVTWLFAAPSTYLDYKGFMKVCAMVEIENT